MHIPLEIIAVFFIIGIFIFFILPVLYWLRKGERFSLIKTSIAVCFLGVVGLLIPVLFRQVFGWDEMDKKYYSDRAELVQQVISGKEVIFPDGTGYYRVVKQLEDSNYLTSEEAELAREVEIVIRPRPH